MKSTLSLFLTVGILSHFSPVFSASMSPEAMDKQAEQTKPFDNGDDDETLAPGEVKDPLEPLNRFIFGVNQRVDGAVLRPVAQVYDDVTPKPIRDCVTNAMSNLWFPINFANFILQGRMENAGKSFFRFIINSTMGVLGIFDAAAEFGLEKEDTGFGDTLGSWGVEAGPYVMLPLFGPSTFRGTIGFGADYFGHPLYLTTHNKKVYNRRNKHHQWWHWYVGKQALEFVNTRANYIKKLDDLEKESLDYYLAIRSLHGQDIQAAQDKIQKDRAKIMTG
ncbi:MAG: VacJ family lipoprotein [Alphaproteobacteria bacterium]|nr:VacJ family lipoprotein [Alphaproteobacteria bacterium]